MVNNYTPQEKMDLAGIEIHKFLRKEFQITDTIPYKVNNRLRVSMGRICFKVQSSYSRFDGGRVGSKIVSAHIEYHGKFLEQATLNEVIAVGKHEALHYACKKLGKPYADGSDYFESQLKKYNLPSQKDLRSIKDTTLEVTKKYREQPKHYIECMDCGELVAVRKRTPSDSLLTKYKTNCCKARLYYTGRLELEDAKLRFKTLN